MIQYELDYSGLKFEIAHMGTKGDDRLGLIYTGNPVAIAFFKTEVKGMHIIPPQTFHPDEPITQQSLSNFLGLEPLKKYSPKLIFGEVLPIPKTGEVPETAVF